MRVSTTVTSHIVDSMNNELVQTSSDNYCLNVFRECLYPCSVITVIFLGMSVKFGHTLLRPAVMHTCHQVYS